MTGKSERRRVLLLASYCGVADVDCTILAVHGGLDFVRERGAPHPSEVHPDPSRAQDEVTERSRADQDEGKSEADTAKS